MDDKNIPVLQEVVARVWARFAPNDVSEDGDPEMGIQHRVDHDATRCRWCMARVIVWRLLPVIARG